MTRRDWIPLLPVLALILVLALPVLTYPLGRDQGEFATIGRGLLQGQIPYIDLWNPKPPAVFYVYAAVMAVFGQTSTAIRVLDLLIVPLVSAALYWLGWKIGNRRTALLSVLVFATFYLTESFWTLSQNDGIVLVPMTLAVALALKTAERAPRSWLWSFASGVMCGIAVWFKYPFALIAGAAAAMYLIALPREQRGGWALMRDVAGFLVGGEFMLVIGASVFISLGAFDALLESALVTSQYTALGLNWADFTVAMATAWGFRWIQWGLLFALTALWFATGKLGNPNDIARKRTWSAVLVWLTAALIVMLVQAKGYDYHWLPMLPPLALLAADTLNRINGTLYRFIGLKWAHVSGALIMLALLAILVAGIWPKTLPYLTGQESQQAYYARFVGGEFVADESLLAANYLREHTTSGDSLFIWGFRPEVYYLSGLKPAARFIFQFPLVASWYPEAWRQQTVDTLWAAMPPYALVVQGDYMPWVTGRDADSNTLLQEYTELNNWLMANYERETQIGNFFLWRRKS